MIRTFEGHLPVDPAIPALGAAADYGLGDVLDRVGLRVLVSRMAVLKHHLGDRCTLLLDCPGRRLVFKAYAQDPSPIARVLRVLSRHGLGSGHPPTVTPLEAVDADLRFLVFRWLEGARARELLGDGAGDRVGSLAVTWLRAAHPVELRLGDVFDPGRVLLEASRWRDALARADAEIASDAAVTASTLEAKVPLATPHGLCHGSFSPSHLVDLREGPGLIDWDSFCQGPIELDAGNFLAVLSRIGTGIQGRREADRAARTFRAGLSDLVKPDVLEWYRAAMLVKHAKYMSIRHPPRWKDRAGALLADARAALEPLP